MGEHIKFRTEEAKAAYREILEDVSERAIRMYEEVKASVKSEGGAHAAFMLNMEVEKFQRDGLVMAINAGIEVDCHLASVKGHIAAAVINR